MRQEEQCDETGLLCRTLPLYLCWKSGWAHGLVLIFILLLLSFALTLILILLNCHFLSYHCTPFHIIAHLLLCYLYLLICQLLLPMPPPAPSLTPHMSPTRRGLTRSPCCTYWDGCGGCWYFDADPHVTCTAPWLCLRPGPSWSSLSCWDLRCMLVMMDWQWVDDLPRVMGFQTSSVKWSGVCTRKYTKNTKTQKIH